MNPRNMLITRAQCLSDVFGRFGSELMGGWTVVWAHHHSWGWNPSGLGVSMGRYLDGWAKATVNCRRASRVPRIDAASKFLK